MSTNIKFESTCVLCCRHNHDPPLELHFPEDVASLAVCICNQVMDLDKIKQLKARTTIGTMPPLLLSHFVFCTVEVIAPP